MSTGRRLSLEKMFWLCLFGGVIGAHSFWAGRRLRAFLQLCSLSALGLWWIYDLGLIISNKFTDADQKIISSSLQPSETANFTMRFIAFIIDFIILNFLVSVISLIVLKYQLLSMDYMTYSLVFLNLGIYLVYFCSFGMFFYATPGKIFMHLRITSIEGGNPSKVQIIVRYFGYFISQMLATIGFLMILFRNDRMALHDFIAETKVVYTGQLKLADSFDLEKDNGNA